MASANLLAMIADPNTGDPAAYYKGAQAGNALMKYRNDAQAQALLPSALAGDKNALSQIAQFSPELGLRLDERNYDRSRDAVADRRAAASESRAQWDFQRRQAIDKAQRVAQVLLSADTPEKHAQAISLLRAQGIQFAPGEDAFENREGLINQALTIEQQIDMRAPKAPDLETLYDENTGQEYKARFNPQTGGYDRVGGLKANKDGLSVTTNPDGTVSVVQGGSGKPLTEAQSKDTVFTTRATGALPLVDEYGDALTSLPESVGGKAPVIGNYMKSPKYQQAEQAGLEFLQAILRKDTGAAITVPEQEQYGRVYLPQPGDSPQVLAQKKVSRRRAVEALRLGLPPQAILALEGAGYTAPPKGADAPETPPPRKFRDGQTATNPQTGQRMIFRGGQWVLVQ